LRQWKRYECGCRFFNSWTAKKVPFTWIKFLHTKVGHEYSTFRPPYRSPSTKNSAKTPETRAKTLFGCSGTWAALCGGICSVDPTCFRNSSDWRAVHSFLDPQKGADNHILLATSVFVNKRSQVLEYEIKKTTWSTYLLRSVITTRGRRHLYFPPQR
jgi:hypothetical protein